MIFDYKKPSKTAINSVIPFLIGANNQAAQKGVQPRIGFAVGYESGHIRVYLKNDSVVLPYKRSEPDKDDLLISNLYE